MHLLLKFTVTLVSATYLLKLFLFSFGVSSSLLSDSTFILDAKLKSFPVVILMQVQAYHMHISNKFINHIVVGFIY